MTTYPIAEDSNFDGLKQDVPAPYGLPKQPGKPSEDLEEVRD